MLHAEVFPEVIRRARRINVGEGHLLYIEERGAADGLPVLFLHGGPGSGCSSAQRQFFEGLRYRVIFVDQRGAGSSLPQGDLLDNTTQHLIADLETIREVLGIERWVVFGGSWGCVLGLAYAQCCPERVLGLVLRGIFLGSREEIAEYVRGFLAWEGAQALGAAGQSWVDFVHCILFGETEQALLGARAWLDYEAHLMGEAPLSAVPDARQWAKVRIQMHYLSQDCFLAPGRLLAGVPTIRHLPGVIVQGGQDPVCPPQHAQTLHRAWPEAVWMPVAEGGHGGLTPAIRQATLAGLAWIAEVAEAMR